MFLLILQFFWLILHYLWLILHFFWRLSGLALIIFGILGIVMNKRRTAQGQKPVSLMPVFLLATLTVPSALGILLNSLSHQIGVVQFLYYHWHMDAQVFFAWVLWLCILVMFVVSVRLLIKSIRANQTYDAAFSTAAVFFLAFQLFFTSLALFSRAKL